MSKSKARIARELGLNGNDLNNIVLAEMHARVEREVDAGVEIYVRAAENQRNMRRMGGGNVLSFGKRTLHSRQALGAQERRISQNVLALVGR